MKTAAQLGLELNEKQQALAKMFKDARKEDGSYDFTGEQLTEVHKRNDETEALAKQYDEAVKLERIAAAAEKAGKPVDRLVTPEAEGKAQKVRDLGEILRDAGHDQWAKKSADMTKSEMIATFPTIRLSADEVKTLVTLSGIAPNDDRRGMFSIANAVTTIDDTMLSGTTTSNTVTYYEETTETDNTDARVEGSAVTDNAFVWTLRTDTVRAYTSWIPATREALSDNGQLETFIRSRLPLLLAKKRTLDLIDGTGAGVHVLGLMRRTGVQTQAKGNDPTPDAIFKAMTLCAVTGDATPTTIVMHPNDWQDVRLLRTVDGIYIWGSPADSGPARMWGLDVRVTPQAVENTAVVYSGPFFQITRNGGMTFEASTEHSTYFTERSVALLAEERFAFECHRGNAVVKVTGI